MIRALFAHGDADLRTITALSLRLDSDFTVETSESASGALARLRRDDTRYDIILLGATTPTQDGTTIEAIRSLAISRATPVVFLTTRITADGPDRYANIGAAGTIAVPFDPVRLPQQVLDLIKPPVE